ncbi:LOW QUALITY PROTEIN: hypothetical protein KUTeg_024695 [Tegillarca granosa]|uniref:Uncharacterized protein n=1 Tax=Tegillarca granosa TaxID=220873 RepID=A0ABQ9DYL6_TEGGR|nr:LOW QUALITY PROTEIN: hypothetical protein KUTeg_024695 [Tegillarca granosa]
MCNYSICALSDKEAWCGSGIGSGKDLVLIQTNGTIKKKVNLDHTLYDITVTSSDDVIFTEWEGHTIKMYSSDEVTTVANNTIPNETWGLCVTSEQEILVPGSGWQSSDSSLCSVVERVRHHAISISHSPSCYQKTLPNQHHVSISERVRHHAISMSRSPSCYQKTLPNQHHVSISERVRQYETFLQDQYFDYKQHPTLCFLCLYQSPRLFLLHMTIANSPFLLADVKQTAQEGFFLEILFTFPPCDTNIVKFASAPALSKCCTMMSSLLDTAICNGDLPDGMALPLPQIAVKRGLMPLLDRAFTLPPALTSNCVIPGYHFSAATCNGVIPEFGARLTSQSALINSLMVSI